MRGHSKRQQTLIATLGSEPQVVTLVLDRLLAQRRAIDEVTVVYTAAQTVQKAMDCLRAEFARAVYPGTILREAPVLGHGFAVTDLKSEDDMWALLRTLYRELQRVKREGRIAHMAISGGRKVMAIASMVVAQLLFDKDDRMWHLLSEGWQPGSEQQLHLPLEEQVWLVPVPVLRWTDDAAIQLALGNLDDPAEAIRRQEMLARSQGMRRRKEFLERWLSQAERQVVQAACDGLDNAAIARRLHKSERTVANQLTRVYAKLGEWLGFPEQPPDRSVLIAEFAPYLLHQGALPE